MSMIGSEDDDAMKGAKQEAQADNRDAQAYAHTARRR